MRLYFFVPSGDIPPEKELLLVQTGSMFADKIVSIVSSASPICKEYGEILAQILKTGLCTNELLNTEPKENLWERALTFIRQEGLASPLTLILVIEKHIAEMILVLLNTRLKHIPLDELFFIVSEKHISTEES